MTRELRSIRSEMVFPLSITLTFPISIIGFWLLSRGTLPVQALIVMVGAFAMSITWTVMSLGELTNSERVSAKAEDRAEAQRELAIASHALLEPVYAISPLTGAASIVVTDAHGICPRGFQIDDKVTANAEGLLSRPLCRAAAGVLAALVNEAMGERGFTPQVSCICPMGNRHITFELRPQALLRAN